MCKSQRSVFQEQAPSGVRGRATGHEPAPHGDARRRKADALLKNYVRDEVDFSSTARTRFTKFWVSL